MAVESTSDGVELFYRGRLKENGLSTGQVKETDKEISANITYYEANAKSEGEADERIDQNSLFESSAKSLG